MLYEIDHIFLLIYFYFRSLKIKFKNVRGICAQEFGTQNEKKNKEMPWVRKRRDDSALQRGRRIKLDHRY